MKVLYLNADRGIPVLGDKGASVHVREFVTAAAALGHSVCLACTALGEGNPPPPVRILHLAVSRDPERLLEACERHQLPRELLQDDKIRREIELLAHDLSLPGRVAEALTAAEFRPQVLYERQSLFSTAGIELAAALGIPRILEVNAPIVEEQARYRGLHLADIAADAEARSYRGADSVIAVSRAVAEHIGARAPGSRNLRVLANGVDVARFHPARNARAGRAIRERLDVGEAPVVGFIGSFKAWHGVDLLLEAFEKVAALRPTARLIAVGDGPEWAGANERARRSPFAPQIHLPGRAPYADIPGWLAAMDITVAPYAPQPNFYFSPLKMVESLAAGRPVVAPDIAQLRDFCSPDQGVRLFTPSRAESCAAAIGSLIDDAEARRRLGKTGRALALERDWSTVVAAALRSVDLRGVEMTA